MKTIIAGINQIQFSTLVFLCILQMLTILLLNFQWYRLGKLILKELTFKKMLDIHMTGTFFESITPAAKTGGEAVKVILMKKKFQSSYGSAVAVIALQKIFSMTAFVPLSLFSILYLFYSYPNISKGTIITAFFIFLIMVVVLLVMALGPQAGNFQQNIRIAKWKWTTSLLSQLSFFRVSLKRCKKQNWFVQIILATIIWSLFPIKAVVVSNSLQLDVGLWAISAVTCVAYLVAMLPLTPGGIGTFEGTVVLLLGIMNIPVAEALAFAFLVRILTYWFPFVISFLYCIWTGLRVPSPEKKLTESTV